MAMTFFKFHLNHLSLLRGVLAFYEQPQPPASRNKPQHRVGVQAAVPSLYGQDSLSESEASEKTALAL